MMAEPVVYPGQMIKLLVGEEFSASMHLTDDYGYRVELYTNVNGARDTYPMELNNGRYEVNICLKQSGFFTWQIRYQREGTKTWRWLKDQSGRKMVGQIQVDPAWLDQAIAYNVFVRFFRGVVANDNNIPKPGEGGTFDDVKAHLDELAELGVSILYFNPIHLIGELYRKYNLIDALPPYWQPGSPYSIKDYKSIDPELTYDRDTKRYLLSDPQKEFLDLITAAHERGMHVIMDLVFNHTAHDFVFQRIRPEWYLYKENTMSLDEPYLYPEDLKKGKPWGDAKHTVPPYDHGVWFEDTAQLNWEYMLPKGLNEPPKNPSLKEMWEYFKSIPKYWVRHFGVDGFRCDIAYRVPPRFWKACIAETRLEAREAGLSLSKDAVFIAEAYTDGLEELQAAGFSAVYGDFSNKLSEPEDFYGYMRYMRNISTSFFPEGAKWFVFPESHDFARTPEKILGEAKDDEHLSILANQTRWFITATVPGIPLIFNGFEKVELKPVNLFSYGAVDWERQTDLCEFMKKINKLRATLPALSLTAEYVPLMVDGSDQAKRQVIAYLRQKASQTVLVMVNIDVRKSVERVHITLPVEFACRVRLKALLNDRHVIMTGPDIDLELDVAEARLYVVEKFV
jgi:glycosidase